MYLLTVTIYFTAFFPLMSTEALQQQSSATVFTLIIPLTDFLPSTTSPWNLFFSLPLIPILWKDVSFMQTKIFKFSSYNL